MKYQKAMVAFFDLGPASILTASYDMVDEHCKNHGHYIHTVCENTGNQQAESNHGD